MKKVIFLLVVTTLLSNFTPLFSHDPEPSNKGKLNIISHPFEVTEADWYFKGTTNLLFVSENRSNPQSRNNSDSFL